MEATRARRVGDPVRSVTKEEIESFWRRKKMEEEDHLFAAEKAAARIRAQALTEGDYRRFEESLWAAIAGDRDDEGGEKSKEASPVGIKDCISCSGVRFCPSCTRPPRCQSFRKLPRWTKSKYAYLNQPAIKSMGEDGTTKRVTSTYVPQRTCFFYSHAKSKLISSVSLGVF